MKTYWGNEYQISENVKILDAIKPLSVQLHKVKTETWIALTDSFITIGDEFIELKSGDSIEILPETLHCLLKGKVLEIVDKPDKTIRAFDWLRNR